MSNKIDKIFNKRLADHATIPPANAWARVEANLEKKNKEIIWFRWAAGLLIPVLIAGTVLWFKTDDKDNNANATSKIEKQQIIPQKIQEEKVASTVTISKKSIPSIIESKKIDERKSEQTVAMQNINTVAETTSPSIKNDSITHDNPVTVIQTPVTTIAQYTGPALKPIVLEYTLESIEPPAPVKTEKGITVVVELKEKKKLQKVIDFARDAKNSEGPFATIRQAKEDLFAFNFKKDKTKKQ